MFSCYGRFFTSKFCVPFIEVHPNTLQLRVSFPDAAFLLDFLVLKLLH